MDIEDTIGVMDYGIGGMGLYSFLRQKGFQGNICYISDAGNIPYGKLPRKQLSERIEQILGFFRMNGISRVALACNAAASVLEDVCAGSIEVKNIINSAVETVTQRNIHSLAVFAGEGTVRSNIYKRLLETSGIKVIQKNTQPLSINIEAGDVDSDELKQNVKKYCQSLNHVDAILLACTHYPAIMHLFHRFLDEKISIIDPAENFAQNIIHDWGGKSNSRIDVFYTTGDAVRMRKSSEAAFKIKIHEIRHITI